MPDPNEFNPGFEPSNPFTLDAKMNGSQAQPTEQTSPPNEQLPQQTPMVQQAAQPATQEEKPMTMGRIAQEASFKKGDYFSHDRKVYHRDSEGNTWLVTGDAMGDVKLDADQVAQLEKSRAEQADREKASKEGLIYTDQVPSGVVDPNDPQYAFDESTKASSGRTITFEPPTEYEKHRIAQIAGAALGTYEGGIAALKSTPHLPRMIGNGLLYGGKGFSSGYSLAKWTLDATNPPIIPRVNSK